MEKTKGFFVIVNCDLQSNYVLYVKRTHGIFNQCSQFFFYYLHDNLRWLPENSISFNQVCNIYGVYSWECWSSIFLFVCISMMLIMMRTELINNDAFQKQIFKDYIITNNEKHFRDDEPETNKQTNKINWMTQT